MGLEEELRKRVNCMSREELELFAVKQAINGCTDQLTGLYNRGFFYRSLEIKIAECQRHNASLALVFFDVDNFGEYNKKHGELTGDAVLKYVGYGIARHTRKSDVAARYGGEEFAIALPRTGPEGATIVAERIRKSIQNTRSMHAYGLQVEKVTASAGISQYRQGMSAEKLIGAADKQMRLAKKLGKNRVCI